MGVSNFKVRVAARRGRRALPETAYGKQITTVIARSAATWRSVPYQMLQIQRRFEEIVENLAGKIATSLRSSR